MRVWASPTLSDYSELAFLIHHILLERRFLFCARWPSVGSLEESSITPLYLPSRASRFLDTRLAGLRSRSAGESHRVSETLTNTENRSVSLQTHRDTSPPSLEDCESHCVCAQAFHVWFLLWNRCFLSPIRAHHLLPYMFRKKAQKLSLRRHLLKRYAFMYWYGHFR